MLQFRRNNTQAYIPPSSRAQKIKLPVSPCQRIQRAAKKLPQKAPDAPPSHSRCSLWRFCCLRQSRRNRRRFIHGLHNAERGKQSCPRIRQQEQQQACANKCSAEHCASQPLPVFSFFCVRTFHAKDARFPPAKSPQAAVPHHGPPCAALR